MPDYNAKKISVVFRVDSGAQIGTGHLMRCLALAQALRETQISVHFICRDHKGSVHQRVIDSGFPLHLLPAPSSVPVTSKAGLMHGDFLQVTQDEDVKDTLASGLIEAADIVIIDHYGIDEDWEQALGLADGQLLLAIDDLADRKHAASMILDQNYYRNPDLRYRGKVSTTAELLLGPSFALLRPEFAEAKNALTPTPERDPAQRLRILISFGGADGSGYGLRVSQAILESQLADRVECLLMGGYANTGQPELIQQLRVKYPDAFRFIGFTNTPWKIMAECDLYLGAGGTSTWERCAMGLPGVVYAISKNQVEMSQDLAEAGLQIYLGLIEDFETNQLVIALRGLIDRRDFRLNMGRRSSQLVDGCGLQRVVSTIRKKIEQA